MTIAQCPHCKSPDLFIHETTVWNASQCEDDPNTARAFFKSQDITLIKCTEDITAALMDKIEINFN